jgi:hypothetical protein
MGHLLIGAKLKVVLTISGDKWDIVDFLFRDKYRDTKFLDPLDFKI